MPVQTPFSPSQSFTSFGNSCSSNRLSLPTMARRPIVGGNWKCNPESFSKLDDLIKIMKLEPTKERGCCWWNPWGTPLGDKKLAWKFQMEMDGGQHIPNQTESATSNIELPWVPSGMNATPVPAMSSFALRHCTWRTWHQRSRIASCGIFALECVSGSLRSNTTCCIWHHFFACIYVCMFRRTSTCAPRIVASKAVALSQEKPPWSNWRSTGQHTNQIQSESCWFSQHCFNES